MANAVFISHAGADATYAKTVSNALREAGLDVRMDRDALKLGDSFLSFMESALSTADYCLLLWSPEAARTPWVRMEWEAALHRSIQENRGFLLLARLVDCPPPALLAPRLRVDLFPDIAAGVRGILEVWSADRSAERLTERPVAARRNGALAPTPLAAATVYVTSDEFEITVPMAADLQAPAGLFLDTVVCDFGLPEQLDHKGRIGVRFQYRLMRDRTELARGQSMRTQGVKNNDVLWLETTMTPYASSVPLRGDLAPATFRDEPTAGATFTRSERELALSEYLQCVERSGLGA